MYPKHPRVNYIQVTRQNRILFYKISHFQRENIKYEQNLFGDVFNKHIELRMLKENEKRSASLFIMIV